MAIMRWTPFHAMPRYQVRDRFFGPSAFEGAWPTNGHSAQPLDVYADGDNYVIEMALPGLAPDAVEISVLENRVTISGEFPTAPEGREYLFRERSGGRFERSVVLPAELDAEHALAHYEHGLLRLTVPKAETAKPKRIAVSVPS